MSLTPSTMLPLGTMAPNFSLPDYEGKVVSLNDFKDSKAYIIVFICVHCPYVIHIEDQLSQLAKEYKDKGITTIAINSNDSDYEPEDGVDGMKNQAEKNYFSFPYLVDDSQEIAKAYKAACTPDLYIFDSHKKLIYRGQFDSSRPGRGIATGEDVRTALDAILSNQPTSSDQKPSSGCNIKWKPGNEPSY